MISVDPANNGLNLFAYCGNDPVNHIDENGRMIEGVVVKEVIELLLVIVFAVWTVHSVSTTNFSSKSALSSVLNFDVGIGTIDLPVSLVDVLVPRFADRDEVAEKDIAISDVKRKNDANAVYYGAEYRGINGGPQGWRRVTGPMSYQQAIDWIWITAYRGDYGRHASWGVYTFYSSDAAMIAYDIGAGHCFLDEPVRGQYRHYHPGTVHNRSFLGYEHIHSWFGGII